jgi:hypothetical protein
MCVLRRHSIPLVLSKAGWSFAAAPLAFGGCLGVSVVPPLLDTDGPSTVSESGTDAGETGDGDGDLPATDVLWTDGLEDAIAFDMASDERGSIYVLAAHGITWQGDGFDYAEMRLHRWSVDGNPLFSGVVDDAERVAVGAGQIVLARPLRNGTGNSDVWGLNASAQLDWITNVSGEIEDIAVLSDTSIIAVGHTESGTGDNIVGWVQQLEPGGAPGWSQTFGDPSMRASVIGNVSVSGDDRVVIGGRMGVSTTSSQASAWIARLDASGAEVWSSTLTGGVATDRVADVAQGFGGWTTALVVAEPAEIVTLDDSGNDVRRDPFPWAGRWGEQLSSSGNGGYVVGTAVQDDPACEGPQCVTTMFVQRRSSLGEGVWEATRGGCSAPVGIEHWVGDELFEAQSVVGSSCDGEFELLAFAEESSAWP